MQPFFGVSLTGIYIYGCQTDTPLALKLLRYFFPIPCRPEAGPKIFWPENMGEYEFNATNFA